MKKTKYDVFVGDVYVTTINKNLVERQNVSLANLKLIKTLHKTKHNIAVEIEKTDDVVELHKLANAITEVEFKLQKAWGFPEDIKYHKFWYTKKCTCPKIDNDDDYPHGYYTINLECTLHGELPGEANTSEIETDNNVTDLVLNKQNDVKINNIDALTKSASYLATVADLVGKGDLTKINELNQAIEIIKKEI
jgi:hypothetical protein